MLEEQDIPREDQLLLRRQISTDGRSRAFVNDRQVGVAFLRQLGTTLVEVQGQHEQQGLADQATHTGLLDAFGVPTELVDAVGNAWSSWRQILGALSEAQTALERAAREEEWLRHAVLELAKLAATPDEETKLAQTRQSLQAAERRAEAIAAAQSELTPRDRRAANPLTALRAAVRALGKLVTPTDQTAAPALAALERAEDAMMEAEQAISRLAEMAEPNPRLLEATEERLFALRAAARKHQVAVAELPALLSSLRDRLAALDQGAAGLARLEAEEADAGRGYHAAATQLTTGRRRAAERLQAAVMTELPPLRLEKARFIVEVADLPADRAGPAGLDLVRFLIAANPGQPAGPLDRVASGGELSRLMLALKVVLARASPVPSLVFDEVDSGIGGATASAVGERIARVAEQLQVMLVTHSPQVAARGTAHLRVAKFVRGERTETVVHELNETERREEIARMLAGETITEAARHAADVLLNA